VLPWSSFWSHNYFVLHWPAAAPWLLNDFVRGGVTGLGIINVAAGIADLVPVFLARDPFDLAHRRAGRDET